jgi:hypothetical protein
MCFIMIDANQVSTRGTTEPDVDMTVMSAFADFTSQTFADRNEFVGLCSILEMLRLPFRLHVLHGNGIS